MGKVLSWIAIAFAIYVAYKIVLALQRKSQIRDGEVPDLAAREAKQAKPPEPKQLTTLIACAHCGLQLPKEEAVTERGSFFCGQPHARLGVRNPGDT
jgi:uncharacterized protein